MARRPRGYGLTAELEMKKREKYDPDLELEARKWIEAIIGRPLTQEGEDPDIKYGYDGFRKVLTGNVLCQLMNEISPGSVKGIPKGNAPFLEMEKISKFLDAIDKYGVKKFEQFQTCDLYEGQNMTLVVNTIFALGRVAQQNGFNGPKLGKKGADSNPRHFDEEVLRKGETVIGLQMGSNKGASQAGSVVFGKTRSINDTY